MCVELCEGGFTIPELVPKWEVNARIGKGADVVVGTKVGFLQRKFGQIPSCGVYQYSRTEVLFTVSSPDSCYDLWIS